MCIKYTKNRLKTSHYEAHPEWIIPYGSSHYDWEVQWDASFGKSKNQTFSFDLRVSRVIPDGLSHCVPQAKTVHAGYLVKRDDPDGLPHFVPT